MSARSVLDTGLAAVRTRMSASNILNDPLYLFFILASAAFFAIVFGAYYHLSHPPYDSVHDLDGRDFVNMWMGARAALARAPDMLFEFHRYNGALRQLFAPDLAAHNWSYPPQILLLIWPFGLFPYLVSYGLWLVLGLCAFAWAGTADGLRWKGFLFLLLSPVTMINVFTGQNGLLLGAVLYGALFLRNKRPVLAGVLLGVMSVKPQLVMLVPVMLALTRNWRCIVSAAATIMALAAATTAIFGADVWSNYWRYAVPIQNHVLLHGSGAMLSMMPTAFMNMRYLGMSLDAAWPVQALVSVVALIAVLWTFLRPRDETLAMALLLVASLLFTPYAFNYDMAALTIVLWQIYERPQSGPRDRVLVWALWLLPIAMMLLGLYAGITGSALVLLAACCWLLDGLRQSCAVSAASSLSLATVSITRTSASGSCAPETRYLF